VNSISGTKLNSRKNHSSPEIADAERAAEGKRLT
jgi:hypothetical protein